MIAAGRRARRPPASPRWAGALVALAGVGLVASGGGSGASLAGDLLVLVSVVGAAALIVVQPRLLAGRDPGAVTAVQLGAAALAALPVAAVAEGAPPRPPRPRPSPRCSGWRWPARWPRSGCSHGGRPACRPSSRARSSTSSRSSARSTGVVAFQEAVGAAQALGGLAILAGIAVSALSGRASVGHDTARATVSGARWPIPRHPRCAESRRSGRSSARTRRRCTSSRLRHSTCSASTAGCGASSTSTTSTRSRAPIRACSCRRSGPYREFESMEDVCNYLLGHKEVLERIGQRRARRQGRVRDVRRRDREGAPPRPGSRSRIPPPSCATGSTRRS